MKKITIKTSGIESGTQFGRPSIKVSTGWPETDGAGVMTVATSKETAILRQPSDRISKRAIDLLLNQGRLTGTALRELVKQILEKDVPGLEQQKGPWFMGVLVDSNSVYTGNLYGLIGFKDAAGAGTLANAKGLLASKINAVMWDAVLRVPRDSHVEMTLDELCDRLQYKRRSFDGSHKTETKERVSQAFLELVRTELLLVYVPPRGTPRGLLGAFWDWSMVLGYSIKFRPGAWYSDPEWHKNNGTVCNVPSGFLRSSVGTHERHSTSIAHHLTSLMRMNKYEPQLLKVSTLLDLTGLTDAERHDPTRTINKLERAMSMVCRPGFLPDPARPDEPRFGVVAEWEYYRPKGMDDATFDRIKDRERTVKFTPLPAMEEKGEQIAKARKRRQSTRRRRPAGDAQG
jgi:hypothetical protein